MGSDNWEEKSLEKLAKKKTSERYDEFPLNAYYYIRISLKRAD